MCQMQKLASKNRRMSVASIPLEVAEVEGQLVSAQTIPSQKEASSEAGSQKKTANTFLKTTWPRA